MSLINQMLRDLDARQASGPDRAGLPSRLRPLPPARLTRKQSMRMLLIGMALGGTVAGAGVALTLLMLRSEPSQVPLPAAQAPSLVAAPSSPLPQVVVPAPSTLAPPSATVVDEATVAPPTQATVTAPPPLAAAPVLSAPLPISPPAAPAKPSPGPVKTVAEPVRQAPPPVAERKPVVPERMSKPAAVNVATQVDKPGKTEDPGHDLAETEYQKGIQAVNNGDQAAALPLFRNALSLNPRLAHARQALMSVLVSGRMWDEAREVAQAGLTTDPTRTGWAVILTRLQHERGDTDAALKTLETHLNYANDDADYLSLYAFLLHRGQRYPEAVRQYRSALALRPKEGRWWYGLGMALAATGREEEAKVAYVKAREVGNLPADMQAVIEERLK